MEGVREGRHLAAIMFVDMVGFTARMQASESRTIETVRELWETFRPLLAKHGGREIDLAGDGMLTEFSGALAAVRCAQAIHAALHAANKPLPAADRVLTRAGVHLGDIEHRDGRIYGDGVNIAARILPLAPPGGIAMSAHVHDQLHNVLEQPAQKLGPKKLKGIRNAVEVWCLPGPDTVAADLAAARAAAADGAPSRRWSFAEVVFDERTLELSLRGQAVEIEKKSLDALAVLLARAGEVVTKDELLEAVWPGRIVSESALTTCMGKLRAALADDNQQLIKTVHGFGYRLAAAVKVETHAEASAPHFDFHEGERPALRPLWQLVKRLGQGGQGEAWLARHEKTGEERVYKFALDAAHLASLKREITLSRVLADAHAAKGCFARILDWNLEQPPYFIESEYSRGGSLVDWAIAQGGIGAVALARRLDIAAQAAEAVALAHSVGVLHKDLKPANLLIEPDGVAPRVKLSDFGSGLVLDPDRLADLGITRMGFTKLVLDDSSAATPMYLAPEILAGQPWTSKADIYALGVMLYQLAVGDFSRTLAPGWEREVGDELLREDIAAAAEGKPAERLGDAQALAQRLRTLEERRKAREADRWQAAQAEHQRKKYERYRVRRWWVAAWTTALTIAAMGGFFLWMDASMSLYHAINELHDAALQSVAQGHLARAEEQYRRLSHIMGEHYNVFDQIDYTLVVRWEYARVLVKHKSLIDAREEYAALLAGATARWAESRPENLAAIRAEAQALGVTPP